MARASRDEVLAWIKTRGATIEEASRVHGVPAGTIKTWMHRARQLAKKARGEGSSEPVSSQDETATAVKPNPKPQASRAPRKPSLADVREADRSRILGFKDRVLDHLDSEAVLADTRKARDLVGALVQLSGAVTDLLTLDERTLLEKGNRGHFGEDAERRVHAALEGQRPGDKE